MIHALGVNHNQHDIKDLPDFSNDGRLVLSTCNRTELYTASDPSGFPSAFHYKGRVAVRHVIEVACGIKSMVLGDRHVFHQLKNVYQSASDVKEPIHELIQSAFRAAKKVQVNDSVPLRAVRDAEPLSSALVVGAGQMAKDVVQALTFDPIVTNRTPEKASKLSPKTVRWKRRRKAAEGVEAVFVCTGADTPVINSGGLDGVYDLSNPPNVEGKATRLKDLASSKKDGLGRAKKICRREVGRFMKWHRFYKNKKPVLASIYNTLEEARTSQLEKHGKPEMTEEEVRELTKSIRDKFLSVPAKNLRDPDVDKVF